jgi:hypothetical protein
MNDTDNKEPPKTCKEAIVLETRPVTGARVAKIHHVFFRDAEFGGVFELADNPLCYYGKTPRLKVIMTWFGQGPDSGVCEVTPLSSVEFDGDFDGEVVDNVGLEGWRVD